MGWRRQLANVVVGGTGALVAVCAPCFSAPLLFFSLHALANATITLCATQVNTQTQTPSYLLNPGSTAGAALTLCLVTELNMLASCT